MTALLPALNGLLQALASMMNDVSLLLNVSVNGLLVEVGTTLDKVTTGLVNMDDSLKAILATTNTLLEYLDELMVNLMLFLG